MALRLRSSLLPLYVLSKLLCIHPFSRIPLKKSFWGSVSAGLGAIGYAMFHLASAKLSMGSSSTDNKGPNFVALIIDSYNRYSGLCCLMVIAINAISVQGKLVEAIGCLERVDEMFDKDMSLVVDNFKWAR